MASFLRELRLAARTVRRRPLTSSLVVVMLALGLGVNTALFAVVESVLLRPMPYEAADRVVMLWTRRSPDSSGGVNSYPDYADWARTSRSFGALATYNIAFGTLTGAGDPEEIYGTTVSSEYFQVLRVPILKGRGLQPGDELIELAAGRPIVLSHGLWTRRFSADPSIIGRHITLGGRSRLVVGLVAPVFQHPDPFFTPAAEYWTPMAVSDEMRAARGSRYLRVIGRLGDGVTLAAAAADMDGIGRRLMEEYPATNSWPVVVVPLRDELVGDVKATVLIFLAATGLVLLLVIANVVNLLLARLSERRSELAIRAALGAGRARLIAIVLAESLLLGLAGGLAGLALAQAGIRLVHAYGPQVFGLAGAGLNVVVVFYAVALTLVTALICGVAPAVRMTRRGAWSDLGDLRTSGGVGLARRRTLLIAAEMALAVPLLLGAILLVRTLVGLQRVDPGFDPAQALQFRVNLPAASYESDGRRIEFFRSLMSGLHALPGVTSAGASSSVPLGGLNNTGGAIVYERLDGSLAETGVGTRAVTSGYFRALGVPLLQGRFLNDDASDRLAVVINESTATTLWPRSSAVSRRIRNGTLADAQPSDWLTVVGVVGDVRHEALSRPANTEIFQPYAANPWTTMTVVVRGDATETLAGPIRSTVRDLDPRLPIVNLSSVRTFVDQQLARPRFGAFAALILGGLGIVLTAAGTFGVLWLLVGQRTREIGIRMALGATPRTIATLIVAQSMKPAVAGVIVGLLASAWLGRALDAMLFEIQASDPRALVLTVGGVLLVALLASWLPARLAMRTDPVRALRHSRG